MKIMAIDLGDTRTGISVCDEGEVLASPVCVIVERNKNKLLEKVAEQGRTLLVKEYVVGYPKNMNNTVGERAEICLAFADKLREKTGLSVVMRDERCTTVSAHQILNVTNTRGQKRKAVIDAVAATIILQDYIDYRKNINKKQEEV